MKCRSFLCLDIVLMLISVSLPMYTVHAQENSYAIEKEEAESFYDVAADGTVTITEKSGEVKELTIPTEDITHVFSGYSGLRSIAIPEGVQYLQGEFSGCKNLTSVHLPDSLIGIRGKTFDGCSSLTEINIPEGVTFIGEDAFRDCSSLTDINIPEGVTEIGKEAFRGCIRLRSVMMPDSVTKIEESAFEDCSNLTDINIPKNIRAIEKRAFCGSAISSITLPDGMDMIQDQAFYGCSSLQSIAIPDSVTKIGDWAFEDCSSLTRISIPDGVTKIPSAAFSGCSSLTEIRIPDSVTEIEHSAFSGCSSLKEIEIPDSVTKIAYFAFYDCSSLAEIKIPDSVTDLGWGIGGSLFSGCSSLKSIVIPESITEIESGTFRDCSSLTDITLPDSITTIYSGAFENCSSLKKITIPASVASMSTGSYNCFIGCNSLEEINIDGNNQTYLSIDGVVYDKKKETLVFYPYGKKGEVHFQDTVTTIGSGAFYGCGILSSYTIPDNINVIENWAFAESSLESVAIPNSVTSIGMFAFKNTGLREVGIPASVTSMYAYVFNECSSLKSVVLPDNMKQIPSYTFYKCSSLTDVEIPDSVTEIGYGAFCECSSLKSIAISKNVTKIDRSFIRCKNLEEINVAEENEVYSSKDGVLYDKNKEMLICCPSGKTGEFTIPASVVTLEEGAFNGSALSDIEISDSVTMIPYAAFHECENISTIIIPSSVETIGDYAFGYCNNLRTITIPSSVEIIGAYAFEYCNNLRTITIPSNVKTIGNFLFAGCQNFESVTIQEGMEAPLRYAFSDCVSIGSVTVPPGMEGWFINLTIEDFYYTGTKEQFKMDESSRKNIANIHYGVVPGTEKPYEKCDYKYISNGDSVEILKYTGTDKEVVIPAEIEGKPVVSIDASTFSGCLNLTHISIPEGVTDIGDGIFRYCISLNSVTIPSSVKSLNSASFAGCYSLKDIYFTGTREEWANLLVWDRDLSEDVDIHYEVVPGTETPYEKGEYRYDSDASSVEILGYRGAGGDIVIPSEIEGKKVVRIASEAFIGCEGLTSVTFPEGLVSIEEYAFNGCNLKRITLPESLTKIGKWAFSLIDLEEIYYQGSKEQWLELITSSFDDNEKWSLRDIKIHYGLGDSEEPELPDLDPGNTSVKRQISLCKIRISPDTFIYDGYAQTPSVTIEDGDKMLMPGMDYTVEYKDNINPGTGTVILTGKGSYTGSVTKNFNILAASSAEKLPQTLTVTKTYKKVYGSKPFKLNAKVVTGNGKLTYASSAANVIVMDKNGTATIKGAGIAIITIKASETAEYKKAAAEIVISVSPAKHKKAPAVKAQKGKKLKVSWTKDKNATGYEVQYSTDKKFKNKKATKIVTIKKKATISTTIKKLTAGKKYYVRVRAYKNAKLNGKNQKLYGAWSKSKAVTAKK